VFKLERQIDNAAHAGASRRVHSLQKPLLTSWAVKRRAVRGVAQDNQRKHTAGMGGRKSLTPHERSPLANNLGRRPIGRPTRRMWIPQPGTDERRPLWLPTLHDRVHQALVKLVLEPEWEVRFAPNSDGFRPGRSVQDAIGAICTAIDKQSK
jgi:RNA-directed DNA polymerase